MALKVFAFLLFVVSMARAISFKEQLLTKHNEERTQAKSSMTPLTWSSKLANYAQEWANGCKFGHRSNEELASKNRGENIFAAWGYDMATIGTSAAKSWASEKDDYTYSSNSCKDGEQCGHYTAMVWEATTKVGCGSKECSDGMQVVVCNYSPAGNMIGSKPY
ncbi:uncharacterized protein LOC135501513 [Lineus longissimus]|uniref:uncharacterized protein LOC135501513 n=1 Tax=Lineus longissimus TaxID=88925 RepID=UPI002B4EE89E